MQPALLAAGLPLDATKPQHEAGKLHYRLIHLPNGIRALLVHDSSASGGDGDEDDEEDFECDDDSQEEGASETGSAAGHAGAEEGQDEGDEEGDDEDAPATPPGSKAAIAVAIGTGSFADGCTPGLAHFCEHAVFMGAEKDAGSTGHLAAATCGGVHHAEPSGDGGHAHAADPQAQLHAGAPPTNADENEFDKYLAANGGWSNAYTETERTVYQAEVQPRGFEGALARLAALLYRPLFHPSSVRREVQAIESEFRQAAADDGVRAEQVRCSRAPGGHPVRCFSWGNAESLLYAPARALAAASGVAVPPTGSPGEAAIDAWIPHLITRLREFHARFYRPERTAVVVRVDGRRLAALAAEAATTGAAAAVGDGLASAASSCCAKAAGGCASGSCGAAAAAPGCGSSTPAVPPAELAPDAALDVIEVVVRRHFERAAAKPAPFFPVEAEEPSPLGLPPSYPAAGAAQAPPAPPADCAGVATVVRALTARDPLAVATSEAAGTSLLAPSRLFASPLPGGPATVLAAVPTSGQHTLGLWWPLPPVTAATAPGWYAARPHDVLGAVLGHEAQGTVLAALKARGLATALMAGVGAGGLENNSSSAVLECSITLTPEGVSAWPEVVSLVCSYVRHVMCGGIDALGDSGSDSGAFWGSLGATRVALLGSPLPASTSTLAALTSHVASTFSRVHEEEAHLSAVRYEYEEDSDDVVDHATGLAEALIEGIPDGDVLRAGRLYGRFDAEAVAYLLAHLHVRNMGIFLLSKEVAPLVEAAKAGQASASFPGISAANPPALVSEPWFSTDYLSWKVPEETAAGWAAPQPLPGLAMHRPNPFVPTPQELALKTPPAAAAGEVAGSTSEAAVVPVGVSTELTGVCPACSGSGSTDVHTRLFHCNDPRFRIPETHVRIQLTLPALFDESTVLVPLPQELLPGAGPRSPAAGVPWSRPASGTWTWSTLAAALMELVCKLTTETLNEDVYFAETAGLALSITPTVTGIELSLSGLCAKLPVLLERVMAQLTSAWEVVSVEAGALTPPAVSAGGVVRLSAAQLSQVHGLVRRELADRHLDTSSHATWLRQQALRSPMPHMAANGLRKRAALLEALSATEEAVLATLLSAFTGAARVTAPANAPPRFSLWGGPCAVDVLVVGNETPASAKALHDVVLAAASDAVARAGGKPAPRPALSAGLSGTFRGSFVTPPPAGACRAPRFPVRQAVVPPAPLQSPSPPLIEAAQSEREESTLVVNYYQAPMTDGPLPMPGGVDAPQPSLGGRMRAALELLVSIMSEPCFNTLRTKQQLGYVVHCSLEGDDGGLGVSVTVKSATHTPTDVDARIEAWLAAFREELAHMDELPEDGDDDDGSESSCCKSKGGKGGKGKRSGGGGGCCEDGEGSCCDDGEEDHALGNVLDLEKLAAARAGLAVVHNDGLPSPLLGPGGIEQMANDPSLKPLSYKLVKLLSERFAAEDAAGRSGGGGGGCCAPGADCCAAPASKCGTKGGACGGGACDDRSHSHAEEGEEGDEDEEELTPFQQHRAALIDSKRAVPVRLRDVAEADWEELTLYGSGYRGELGARLREAAVLADVSLPQLLTLYDALFAPASRRKLAVRVTGPAFKATQ